MDESSEGTRSRWDTGLPDPDEMKRIARAARALPREPAGLVERGAFLAASLVWLVTVAVVFCRLPNRVPTHWSSQTPDGWSSRWGALTALVLGPGITVAVLIGVSALTVYWPDGINAPNKAYWLATPQRLRQFERILREDMLLIAALTMLLFAAIAVIIGVAARRDGGQMPNGVFVAVLVTFLVGIFGVVARVLVRGRYRGPAEA